MPPIKFYPVSPYSKYGYTRELQQKIKEIPLPLSLRCSKCRLHFPTTMYSNRQLTALREAVFMEGEGCLFGDNAKISCTPCTFNEKAEALCRICDQMLCVEYFAKAQRNLENPVCRRCRWHIDNDVDNRPVAAPIAEEHETAPAPQKSKSAWARIRKSDMHRNFPGMAEESRKAQARHYAPPRFISERAAGILPNIPPPGNTGYPADESGYPGYGEDDKSFCSGRDSEWDGSSAGDVL